MKESKDYQDGYDTGLTWKQNYRPGGPWQFFAHKWEKEETQKIARQTQVAHSEWMRGFGAGLHARDAARP